MATYDEIGERVKQQDGFVPKDCWIAHVMELNGLPVRRAWNGAGPERAVPWPDDRRSAIERALLHFRMI